MNALPLTAAVTVGALAGAAATALLLRRSFELVDVQGGSMEPTLRDGDRVLVRRTRVFRRGDVVVFPVPDGPRDPADAPWLVKRVSGVAGDPAADGCPAVPPGHLAVLGDNPRSLDSRTFGTVPSRTALGVAVRRMARDGRPAQSLGRSGHGTNHGSRRTA
ncbi:S26 family signal peptidase [Kitasatospora sp. CM 4170]|uniref:Mitochondrial inner membrane protease subunit 2 n=1 Tax=Kitasatospora aburaviensis TaxID=67265 RepID=A0ABW1ETI0_9ACTN|nr:S26 family signal peptidase [Kitasatospora sp. CM 4170]WNM44385.1 S26 family signal peptidase [Kitasatospora sp. CM 4170]